MPARTPPQSGDTELVESVLALAHRHGASWFPELAGPQLEVEQVAFHARPRCFLYRFALSQGAARQEVMVKVRHSQPHLRREDRFPGRPELTPQRTLSDVEAAHHEYVGLRLVAQAMEGADETRFGILHGFAELPEFAAIVMEYVDEPTLRRLVARAWRQRLKRDPGPRAEDDAWGRLGEWLRRFHGTDSGRSLPDRMTARDELVHQLDLSREFLTRAGAPERAIQRLVRSATKVVEEVFDAELPSAVAHGDFTAQNVFVGPGGRLTVFDPLPIWRVCVFEDLARLTMGVRLLAPQVMSGGRLLDPDRLDAWEADLATAYSSRPTTRTRLHVFQAMLLLDRWGEMVSKGPASGRLRQNVRAGRRQVAQRWFREEAHRLTAALS